MKTFKTLVVALIFIGLNNMAFSQVKKIQDRVEDQMAPNIYIAARLHDDNGTKFNCCSNDANDCVINIVTGQSIDFKICHRHYDNDQMKWAFTGGSIISKVVLGSEIVNVTYDCPGVFQAIVTTDGGGASSAPYSIVVGKCLECPINKDCDYLVVPPTDRTKAVNENTDASATIDELAGNENNSGNNKSLIIESNDGLTGNTFDFEIAPNPTVDYMNINLVSDKNANASYTILDVFGKNIANGTIELTKGTNTSLVDLNSLTLGTYVISINLGNETLTKTFVKSN
jgi:hypothetical protein